jgi:hypothetical protein
MTRQLVLGAVLLVSASCSAPESVARTIEPCSSLPDSGAQSAPLFDSIGVAVELSSTATLVVDPVEGVASIVDWKTGMTRGVAPRGKGPGDIDLAWDAFALAPDSVILVDWGKRRLHRIDSLGRFTGTLPRPVGSGRGRPEWLPNVVIGVDRAGRVYTMSLYAFRGGMQTEVYECQPLDTLPCRTVGTIATTRVNERVQSAAPRLGPMRVGARFGEGKLFVTPGGEILALSSLDRTVMRWSNGNWTAIDTLPEWRREMTEQAWNAIVEADSAYAATVTRKGIEILRSAGGNTRGFPEGFDKIERVAERPRQFPPFSRHRPIIAADGDVYIARDRPLGSDYRVSIVTTQGPSRCLSMKGNERVVGVSRGYTYVARASDEEGESLRRIPRADARQ